MRPALFALDAERAHDLTMTALGQPLVASALHFLPQPPEDARLRPQVLGLDLRHPLGLAAGLDKQGVAAHAWAAMGFAFVEVGTVTPRPQPGNPRPRLFRLPADLAIINRFGFNSAGAEQVARHLARGVPPRLRLGVNLGKNKDTPNEQAADDYVRAIDALHPHADYFVVNVSSPNTERLRDLQEGRALRSLVEQVAARVREVTAGRQVPVLVKVSPDAADEDLLRSVESALEGGAAGVVATNTTVSRQGLRADPARAAEAGGLSGAPLRATADRVCRLLFTRLRGRAPIVGVGGIFTADDAYARIRAGAALIQVYTAIVYKGPGVVPEIVGGLRDRLARDGFRSITEATGADVH
jgi:dihydroorotate dehydrogenase